MISKYIFIFTVKSYTQNREVCFFEEEALD